MTKKTNIIVSILITLWALIGVSSYLAQAYMDQTALDMLPEEWQAYYQNFPAWATAAFATAVFSELLAAVLLFFKSKWAYYLFILSLVAVLIQNGYNFLVQDYIAMDLGQSILPAIIIIVNLLMIRYSKRLMEN
ncbi:MAG: hypothetical protein ACPGRE_05985 [Flavobacteriaceae bacterium]